MMERMTDGQNDEQPKSILLDFNKLQKVYSILKHGYIYCPYIRREEGKDQESIQSGITSDLERNMGK